MKAGGGRLVSICIPTYNGARYLPQCLQAALDQTYRNTEILIVDDASSDETASIASRYAGCDPRVRLIVNQHRLGLASNWNRCAELARGDWVKFLFQDDLLEKECVERMMAATHASGPPIVACRRAIVFEDPAPETRRTYAKYVAEESLQGVFGDEREISPSGFCERVLEHIGENFIGEPTAVLLRRTIFAEFGGFNPDLISACDLEYWIRVGVNTGLALVPEVLATFRVHADSASTENVTHRAYRKAVLDPLILLHEFVFHPAFDPLRTAASDRTPPLDLKRMFGHSAVRARTEARALLSAEETSDRWAEWCSLASRYPEIESSLPITLAQLGRLRRRIFGGVGRLLGAGS